MKTYAVLNPQGLILELFSDEPGYPLPPESAVELPPEIAEQLRRDGFAGKQWVDGVLGDAPPPPPPLESWRATTLKKAGAMRMEIFRVLDHLHLSAITNASQIVVNGETLPLATVIETNKQALRDLPASVDLSLCTTQREMEGVVLQAYQAIVLAAPAEIKSAFDSLKP